MPQPFSSDVGTMLAHAMLSTAASRRGLELDPSPFVFSVNFPATALGAEAVSSLKFTEDSYFAWIATAATLFNSVDGINDPYPNDLIRFRFLSAERTIGRQRATATSNPFDGWLPLRGIACSPGAFGGQWLPLLPLVCVVEPSEELEVTYSPGAGAGAAGTNRLFLSLVGCKLYPYQRRRVA